MKLSDNSGPDITVSYRVQDDPSNSNRCPIVKAENECAGVKIKEGNSERMHPVDFEVYVTAFDTSCQDNAKKNQRYACFFSRHFLFFCLCDFVNNCHRYHSSKAKFFSK